jgi:hypothetical protein
MNKETLFSLIRAVAIGFGAYLVGTNTSIFGNPLDQQLWEALVGGLITLIATVWGIVDKTSTIEGIQSGLRSVLSLVGGLLVAAGKIKAEVLTSILAIIPILVTVWQSHTARQKVRMINENKLKITVEPGKLSKNPRPMVRANTNLYNKRA